MVLVNSSLHCVFSVYATTTLEECEELWFGVKYKRVHSTDSPLFLHYFLDMWLLLKKLK
jgi:hypothetical protein